MRGNAAIKPQVDVVNFGCRVNLVEGEALRQVALAQGCDNLTIVNSCTVTAEAARQVRQTIRRLKREAPERRIFVTGCGAQIDPSSFAAMPEVDRVIGAFEKTQPESFAETHERVAVSDVFARKTADLPSVAGVEDHTRAFLAIQTGCDHRCSFCIIPFGRGASRSMPLAQLREAVSACLDKGVNEIVVTGVDLTAYGKDLPEAPSIAQALREVLKIVPDLPRLRLSSIDCIETDEDFLDLMSSEPRLMPHLHLSLQSGDDLILKRMKRRHSRADAVEFCARLRAARPGIVFSADLIAGFPTETGEMFENTVALVEHCGLTHLHVFPFSPRPGTPAARMPQLAPSLIKERAARLREAGARALRRHLEAQIGKRLTLLTERGGVARAEDFTKVRIEGIEAGRIIETTIAGHDGETLRGA